ncbi:MAG: prepilin-type N-terminal cleavage/methylation domain-containing protein [Vicinamibacterales bacterium]
MGQVIRREPLRAEAQQGFTILEVIIAMGVLSVGLLSLVGVFAAGLQRVGSSSNQLIAREKAREAIESVHAARDTGRLSWGSIRNVADGGIFLAGAQQLKQPGNDGIVNTADDGSIETVVKPGPDGLLGTVDDQTTELTNFTREIVITPLNYPNTTTVNPSLRQITVNVRYLVDSAWRTYTLTTYVSSFS